MSKHYRFIISVMLVVILLYGSKVVLSVIKTHNFHPQNTTCQQCHMVQGEITPLNAYQLLSTQEKLCSECHETELKVSHPSGFIPSQDIPGIFPLDWKNELTCSTCHNVHATDHDSIRGGSSGKRLCISCHQMSFFSAMADKGISLQQSVHKGRIKNDYSSADSYSIECMGCHAAEGDTINISINSRGIVKHSSGAVNHPVGMKYIDSYDNGSYIKIEELSKNIILPGGKVSCISCHKGYSKKHGEMVSVKSKTALCLECHDM